MNDSTVVNNDNLIEFPFSYSFVRVKHNHKNDLQNYGKLYGSSCSMQKLYNMIERVAPTDATVLIIGESGTGKELVAETLHQASKRSDKPFIAINCGALPSNLIEAELFGYERGSFTGANRMHKGCFERAAGGTLFLDEITEMAPELQVKLLRVLESGVFYRVGGDQEIRVKVRIVAATNRNPEVAVAQGKLREDLLYRLAVFPTPIPPLRDRGEDIELLAQHFLDLLNSAEDTNKKFSAKAVAALRSYSWPGNVRELKNIIQRSFIMADDVIELDDLRGICKSESIEPQQGGLNFAVGIPLAEAERRLIYATLEHFSGNKRKTAEVLGLSLKTLYNRLTEYENEKLITKVAG
jgi:DNA-binding NtrC family response regulator